MSRIYAYTCTSCGHQGKAVNGLRRCIRCNALIIVLKAKQPINQLNLMVVQKVFKQDINQMLQVEASPANYAGDLKSAYKITTFLESKGFTFSSGVNQEGLLFACFSNNERTHCAQSASMSIAICKAGLMACS